MNVFFFIGSKDLDSDSKATLPRNWNFKNTINAIYFSIDKYKVFLESVFLRPFNSTFRLRIVFVFKKLVLLPVIISDVQNDSVLFFFCFF